MGKEGKRLFSDQSNYPAPFDVEWVKSDHEYNAHNVWKGASEALVEMDLSLADTEKVKVEEEMRSRRKERNEKNEEFKLHYFDILKKDEKGVPVEFKCNLLDESGKFVGKLL